MKRIFLYAVAIAAAPLCAMEIEKRIHPNSTGAADKPYAIFENLHANFDAIVSTIHAKSVDNACGELVAMENAVSERLNMAEGALSIFKQHDWESFKVTYEHVINLAQQKQKECGKPHRHRQSGEKQCKKMAQADDFEMFPGLDGVSMFPFTTYIQRAAQELGLSDDMQQLVKSAFNNNVVTVMQEIEQVVCADCADQNLKSQKIIELLEKRCNTLQDLETRLIQERDNNYKQSTINYYDKVLDTPGFIILGQKITPDLAPLLIKTTDDVVLLYDSFDAVMATIHEQEPGKALADLQVMGTRLHDHFRFDDCYAKDGKFSNKEHREARLGELAPLFASLNQRLKGEIDKYEPAPLHYDSEDDNFYTLLSEVKRKK